MINVNWKRTFLIFGTLGTCLIIYTVLAQTPQDAVAEQLFKSVKAAEERGYAFTQSQAHMSIPKIQNKIRKIGDLAKNKDIIDQCLKKEQELKKTHYVFYTAIPHLRLFQDITRKLYKYVVGKNGALRNKAFQFIRYTYNDPVYSEQKNVTDLLINEITKNGIIDDNVTRLKTILVSTNIAFFGNVGFTGESTYYYFNNPQPWARAKREWLNACLTSFGFSKKYAEELLQLQALTKRDTGDLFQIFVPKDKINVIGYLSWRQGIPFDVPYISKIFERPTLKFSREDKIFAEEINQRVADVKQKWQARDPEIVTLVNALLKNVKAGKYGLNKFLTQYRKNPKSLPFLNYYQARLLVTNDMLLSPESGLLIYRYSKLDPDKEQEYKDKLDEIINRMITETDLQKVKPFELQGLQQMLDKLNETLKNLNRSLTQLKPVAAS